MPALATPDWSQREPAPEWLTPIYSKLDELGQATSQIAQQYAVQEDEYDEPYDGDGYEYDDDVRARGRGLRRVGRGAGRDRRLRATDDEQALADDYIVDRIAGEIDARRLADEDARAAFLDREDMFDALRAELPVLQDEQTAANVVHQARALAEQWGEPELIDRPEFVDLIRLVALAQVAGDGEQLQPRPAHRSRPPACTRENVRSTPPAALPRRATAATSPEIWGDRMLAAAQRMRPDI